MKILAPLLFAATFALAASAAAAGIPPVTAERNDAAVAAYSKILFLETSTTRCMEQVPAVAMRVRGAAEAWIARNLEVGTAANAWIRYAVETTAAGDEARETELTNQMAEVVAARHKSMTAVVFGTQGVNEYYCKELAIRIEGGQFELLDDPATAPILRELVAIEWPGD